MEFANYNPPMLRSLVAQRVFAGQPFVIFDVGCAGGIDSLWRVFGDQLAGVGFDPQESEIARLRNSESNPNITYTATFVGLGNEHDFHQRKRESERDSQAAEYFDALSRSSAAALWRRNVAPQSNVIGENLTTSKVGISEYARLTSTSHIDFIKIDTDGYDLEVALSASEIIRRCGVLGFMIETPFTGSHHDTANSFHNIDRFMRQHGFLPYTMGLRHYARAALPAKFLYDIPAQTTSGQLIWADTIYLRDGASPQYTQVWGEELEPIAVLKLAALYELFGLPDCAAELIGAHRERIGKMADPDRLLDLLTPPFDGEKMSYESYVDIFKSNPNRFFPKKPRLSLAADGQGAASPQKHQVSRLRRLLRSLWCG
jgi:hypothetical protein